MRRSETPVHARTRVHFGNIMLNERNRKQTATCHMTPIYARCPGEAKLRRQKIDPLIPSLALEKGASGAGWRGVAANR